MTESLTTDQLNAIAPYAERLKTQDLSEGSNSADSIISLEETSSFPGATKVHICYLGGVITVDVVQPGGKVSSHEVAG